MSRFMIGFLAVLAVAFAGLTGLAFKRGVLGSSTAQTSPIGGPFQLTDQRGKATDQTVLDGRWSAVFFGFTHCPEICPTTLFALGQAEALLGPGSGRFQTVLISVDPDRDTPQVLANYLKTAGFPRQAVALTGAADQVAAAARAYRASYEKAGDVNGYTVNHSTVIYLMNPQGRFACVIPYAATPHVMAGKISAAMRAGMQASSC